MAAPYPGITIPVAFRQTLSLPEASWAASDPPRDRLAFPAVPSFFDPRLNPSASDAGLFFASGVGITRTALEPYIGYPVFMGTANGIGAGDRVQWILDLSALTENEAGVSGWLMRFAEEDEGPTGRDSRTAADVSLPHASSATGSYAITNPGRTDSDGVIQAAASLIPELTGPSPLLTFGEATTTEVQVPAEVLFREVVREAEADASGFRRPGSDVLALMIRSPDIVPSLFERTLEQTVIVDGVSYDVSRLSAEEGGHVVVEIER